MTETVDARTCQLCGRELPAFARSDRWYYDVRCRVADHRRRHEPAGRLARVDLLDRLVDAVEPALAETSLLTGITLAARADWEGRCVGSKPSLVSALGVRQSRIALSDLDDF